MSQHEQGEKPMSKFFAIISAAVVVTVNSQAFAAGAPTPAFQLQSTWSVTTVGPQTSVPNSQIMQSPQFEPKQYQPSQEEAPIFPGREGSAL
jgi:hypothetical protein